MIHKFPEMQHEIASSSNEEIRKFIAENQYSTQYMNTALHAAVYLTGKTIYELIVWTKDDYYQVDYWNQQIPHLVGGKSKVKKKPKRLEPANIAKIDLPEDLSSEGKSNLDERKEDEDNNLAPVGVKVKIKTRGIADKNKDTKNMPSEKPKQPNGVANGHDDSKNPSETTENLRRKKLEEINDLRTAYSVPKNKIGSLAQAAAAFVSGNLTKENNKINIRWRRDNISHSVSFEKTHKQRNNKGSVFKEYKLSKALDALEYAFLDNWDEDSIRSQLGDRSGVYHVGPRLLKILFSPPSDK